MSYSLVTTGALQRLSVTVKCQRPSGDALSVRLFIARVEDSVSKATLALTYVERHTRMCRFIATVFARGPAISTYQQTPFRTSVLLTHPSARISWMSAHILDLSARWQPDVVGEVAVYLAVVFKILLDDRTLDVIGFEAREARGFFCAS